VLVFFADKAVFGTTEYVFPCQPWVVYAAKLWQNDEHTDPQRLRVCAGIPTHNVQHQKKLVGTQRLWKIEGTLVPVACARGLYGTGATRLFERRDANLLDEALPNFDHGSG